MEKVLNPTVCLFDSGIGGLWLLHECVKKLPNVDFAYFSDNAHVPYGSLSQEKLIELSDAVFDEIAKLNPAVAVIACNTVTARCIEYLRNKYSFSIVGIQPAVKPAVKVGGKCLVLATPATANSSQLHELVEKYGNGEVEVFACPDLAQYIENNLENIDEEYIKSILPKIKCDNVVLGCTHYIYIKDIISTYYKCPTFDGIAATANNVVTKLNMSGEQHQRAQKVMFEWSFATKNRKIFNSIVTRFGLKPPD